MKYFENKYTRFQERKKNIIQALATLATNANLKGFFEGRIYTGNTKVACVPGLNCYSCPGAVGSCPIGSLQAVIGSKKFSISYYVFGIMILIGALLGRLVCGLLCPFGFVQDLLYKIPTPKFKIPEKIDRPLRYLKYAILLVFVILLPMFLTNQFGLGAPYFCKLICPAGTLGGALPLLATNEGLRSTIGFLFFWKLSILIVIVALSIFTYRPFCKYICPLGAFYSFFNKIGFYKMEFVPDKCVNCGLCEKSCKMDINVRANPNSLECIRCGACTAACRHDALVMTYAGLGKKKEDKPVATKACSGNCRGCAHVE
ncbi:4Fe-4S binding protein [Lachnoanaerobaculum sp. JCM 36186]|jgi:4Fe-4S ferredoxin iron-sulfur binding domain protein|uniref:4Fe-4S binding protein n=1 Tax=Lachnoanaerobaculum sanguinis TaxID=3065809 RepID=UPI0027705042|nr:4Fe-4S binding protein [Lachnoanaerobaculum sp. JCM 36186]GMO02071.1 4Fe-4S binding protein [Lachnoanaerobaculum sp. JCM 36186]